MFTKEDVFQESVKYFNGDELAARVWVDKYALKNEAGELLERTPDDMHRRMAKEFARIESKKFKSPMSEDEIFDLLKGFKYIVPQGSPMFGIGNNFQTISLSNCFVTHIPKDSYGHILRTDEQIVQISKRRGGVGTDLSNLRPHGSAVKNAAKTSTGVISWMERYSNSIREVGQSGRRGALMLTISIHHPESVKIDESQWDNPQQIIVKGNAEKFEKDIITDSRFYNPNDPDFCTVKFDRSRVTGANVSIKLTDEFLTAVRDGTLFEQRFPVDYKERGIKPIYSKMVCARKVWQKIIHAAWQSAEPGLLFWDRITSNNAVDVYGDKGFETVCTNPCGELPLSVLDSCRLMVLNLYSYVCNPFVDGSYFDFEKFSKHVQIAQRLMDDMIDLELEKIQAIIEKIKTDPEDDYTKEREITLWESVYKTCKDGRRTGLGVTAVGDMFAALGLTYGSDASIEFQETVQKTLKLNAFRASCDMAKEIGPFPIWDPERDKQSIFIQNIMLDDKKLYDDIILYGRRNIGLMTIAPTGSVSLLTQTTSGIEPLFNLTPYKRRKKVNPNDSNSRVDFVDANGDKWQEFLVYHPKVKEWMEITGQEDITKSPWYNSCSADINWQNRVKLQAAAQRHIDHSISSTLNLPENVTEEEVAKIYLTAWESGCKGQTIYRDNCRSGVLVREDKTQKTSFQKRPEKLECEVFHCIKKKVPYYVCVGLMDGNPYEIFTGINLNQDGTNAIPKTIETGYIRKIKRGQYSLISGDFEMVLTNGHSDDNADALTRLISTSLRHKIETEIIVHQIEKTQGDMQSFAKVISRVLKKYIKNGQKVYGTKCENCGSENVERQEGCITCKDCGWSKCS
jgi:ribonucleoside-diphosphate reductase alpha chain